MSKGAPSVLPPHPETGSAHDAWLARWLDAVADGSAAMSQRKEAVVARHGGVSAAVSAARARSVHLARIVDDKGDVLLAASLHPFEPLC